MSASAVLGYALLALDNSEFGVMTAVIGALTTIVVAIITNFSESRRHKRELRYRSGGQSGSGLNTFLFIALLISVAAGIYYANRPATETNASAAPVETTAPPADTTPTSSAAPILAADPAKPACAAYTVQIAAISNGAAAMAEFETQANLLAEMLPQLGALHSEAGEACGAVNRTQFYFGPFPDSDAARDACFSIGQVLFDNISTFTTFQSEGQIMYPYYRNEPGVSVKGSDGETFLCSPSQ